MLPRAQTLDIDGGEGEAKVKTKSRMLSVGWTPKPKQTRDHTVLPTHACSRTSKTLEPNNWMNSGTAPALMTT
jgi:hypothetical protein